VEVAAPRPKEEGDVRHGGKDEELPETDSFACNLEDR
jgi:hypothetical protein